MKKALVILFVLVVLFVSVVPASAGYGVGEPNGNVTKYPGLVLIKDIYEEEDNYVIRGTVGDSPPSEIWITVTESTKILGSGSVRAGMEKLEVGDIIEFAYYLDNGKYIATAIYTMGWVHY